VSETVMASRITRNGSSPQVAPSATVAATANVVGNVRIGAGCFIDHGVTIVSGGPLIDIQPHVIILPNTVVRSVGGGARPAAPVRIGPRSFVSPMCLVTGATISRNCYVASGAVLLQHSVVHDNARVGVSAIVHARAEIAAGQRVGMRQMAIPVDDGTVITSDVEEARRALSTSDFFKHAFGIEAVDIEQLHADVMTVLLEEVAAWRTDEPMASEEGSGH
jgi:carbonic anhydrase/acetyltransferase-like protein (isoleucine patch superfamily)